MHALNDFLLLIDSFIGSASWFVYFLLGTGLFLTIYLKFPQIRYFKYALKIVRGKLDSEGDEGDTSHFQALTTALSGTVGTGNIAGVAFALHLGGPPALFWMLMTAMIGMTTKFVEVTLSHKYREKAKDGTIAGGPMYFMRKRMDVKLPSGKVLSLGKWIAAVFAVATIVSSFGTGNLPQVNSIADSVFTTFAIPKWITGAVLAILLGFVILGGIKRIAKVTSKLVPAMAFIYFVGAFAVIIYNYQNIIPSVISIFDGLFNGASATGGFLGAGVAYAFNRGVNRGLFSNEAGQGSAPIAHAAARAHEPVSEGLVALLEPFIDTIIICSLTGLTLLSSGVWNEKVENQFQNVDMEILVGDFSDSTDSGKHQLALHISGEELLPRYSGEIDVKEGHVENNISIVNNRSLAESVKVFSAGELYSGVLNVIDGKVKNGNGEDKVVFEGYSLVHSAPLTTIAFTRSWFGDYGKYIVSIGLLLFAFSTAISWSYYGDRAVVYLWGDKGVIWYRIVYVAGFFIASFAETSLVWTISGLTIAFMTIPNLIGLLFLHREVKGEIKNFWKEYKMRFPNERLPWGEFDEMKYNSD